MGWAGAVPESPVQPDPTGGRSLALRLSGSTFSGPARSPPMRAVFTDRGESIAAATSTDPRWSTGWSARGGPRWSRALRPPRPRPAWRQAVRAHARYWPSGRSWARGRPRPNMGSLPRTQRLKTSSTASSTDPCPARFGGLASAPVTTSRSGISSQRTVRPPLTAWSWRSDGL